jgi:hypothetical protein
VFNLETCCVAVVWIHCVCDWSFTVGGEVVRVTEAGRYFALKDLWFDGTEGEFRCDFYRLVSCGLLLWEKKYT